MTISQSRRLTVTFAAACALALAGCGILFWRYGILFVHTALAEEQTRYFDLERSRVLQSKNPKEIAGALATVRGYYPSGTKQRSGTYLDRVVERYRAAVMREIIEHLRKQTGKDLGERPESWIEEYARR